ncbi:hypothetical protein GGP41_004043 [Bipolaris sorokiniana]|uniref:FAD-binding PCMH-type domain-containing protein n=2 Tax=Cochliobolus sativus TaxID=45130 RepID=A0A8H5ZNC1_COCSA|nr:uncharacterized protein COCSADRAFT_231373 [Bipolaris sorokiniana ND90Pr]EMD61427.1 hypothetical protein COCSADRAFT_231373 [Bipolaris sorokiniana ND90Pr]KAF5851240.1 hypothetical protein GGP41_004043 [Bipolaris sorokiniana]
MGNAVSAAQSGVSTFTGGSAGIAGSAIHQCLIKAVGDDNAAFKGDPLYQVNDVKPYNLDIMITPTAVTYPGTADQVAAIVKCAAEYNLPVQSRSGGHSFANYGIGGTDGAVVVDLKHFQKFSIDNSTWQASVGSGTRLGDLTKRLGENGGRAMAYGTCPQVGVGGHALIGGLGPASRMWGALLDHVEEVEVVLANSTVVRASDKQHPDLFFAMKGAGASFGIVTEFKLRTQAAPGNAVIYTYTFQGGSTQSKADLFKRWQKLVSDPQLSRKFASQYIVAGPIGAIITGTYFGSQAEYDSLNLTSRLQTSQSNSSIEMKDWLGVVGHWSEQVAMQLVGNVPAHFYAKTLAYTKKDLMSDDTVDKVFKYIDTADKGGALFFMIWDLEGGAVNDIAKDATAYGHRDALFFHQAYAVNLLGRLNDTSRAYLNGINDVVINSRADRDQGVYPGYVDPALGANSATYYWDDNVSRLQHIKALVDPRNVFRNPQSILPAAKSVKQRAIV